MPHQFPLCSGPPSTANAQTTHIKTKVEHLKVLPSFVQFPLSDKSDFRETGLKHQDVGTPAFQLKHTTQQTDTNPKLLTTASCVKLVFSPGNQSEFLRKYIMHCASTPHKTYSHLLYAIGVDDFDVVSAGDEDGSYQVPHTFKQIPIFILGQHCHHHQIDVLEV